MADPQQPQAPPPTLPADFFSKPVQINPQQSYTPKPPDTLPANFDFSGDSANRQDGSFDLVDAVARFGKNFNEQANPVSGAALRANAQLTAHPIDTAKGMLDTQGNLAVQAGKSFESGNYLDGIRHAIAYLVPFLGPGIDKAGDQAAAGDVAGGLGTAAGIAVPAALGERARLAPDSPILPNAMRAKITNAAQQTANELYSKAIRPGYTAGSKTPTELRALVDTGLQNAIPVTEEGAGKIAGLFDQFNKARETAAGEAAQRGVKVDPWKVADYTKGVEKRFGLQVNPDSDLRDVRGVRDEFLDNNPTPIAADRAEALKEGTYQAIAAKSESAYGKLGPAKVETMKALAYGLKEELNAQIPELASLNAQQAKLYDLQPILEKAINKSASSSSGLKGLVTTGVVKSVTNNPTMAVAAGVLEKVLADPGVRSRMAIAITKAQQNNPQQFGAPNIFTATKRVQSYVNALHQAVSGGTKSP